MKRSAFGIVVALFATSLFIVQVMPSSAATAEDSQKDTTQVAPPSAATLPAAAAPVATAPAATAINWERNIRQSLANHKLTNDQLKHFLQLARTGRGGLFMGKHLALLATTHRDVFDAVKPRDANEPKPIRSKKFTPAEIAMVVDMTQETWNFMKAKEQKKETVQLLSAKSKATEAYAAADPAPAQQPSPPDVAALASCFGLSGAMFALPHPYSYVAAGSVFAGCLIIFSNTVYMWLHPKAATS